jgi:hypothetical protein
MNSWLYPRYSNFRKDQNRIATEYFKSKKFEVDPDYSFILKNHDEWSLNNIILPEVATFIVNERNKRISSKSPRDPFPLHKYIHHGLSSQALLFNLIGHPVLDKNYSFFNEIFGFPDVTIDSSYLLKFEHSCRETFNEDQQQPTSFDFVVLDENKIKRSIFVEAKYIETEFGKCSTIESGECDGQNPISDYNLCYLTHKGRTYWKKMKAHQLDEPYKASPICPLAIYYQYFREFLFALENDGYYVLLVDKRNPAFEKSDSISKRGLIPTLFNRTPAKYQDRFKVIYIQDVLTVLEKHGYTWVDEFRHKYGM